MVKNSVIYLFTSSFSDPQLLLLQRRGKEDWMAPGGGRDKKDQSAKETMLREFEEEVGYKLDTTELLRPALDKSFYFGKKKETKIYVAYTKQLFPPFRPTKEAIALEYVKYRKIFSYRLRECVRKSLLFGMENGYLPIYPEHLKELKKEQRGGSKIQLKGLKYRTLYKGLCKWEELKFPVYTLGNLK